MLSEHQCTVRRFHYYHKAASRDHTPRVYPARSSRQMMGVQSLAVASLPKHHRRRLQNEDALLAKSRRRSTPINCCVAPYASARITGGAATLASTLILGDVVIAQLKLISKPVKPTDSSRARHRARLPRHGALVSQVSHHPTSQAHAGQPRMLRKNRRPYSLRPIIVPLWQRMHRMHCQRMLCR